MIKINDKEFLMLTEYLRKNFGINLSKKRTLVESRLNNYLVNNGFDSYQSYFNYAFNDKSGREMSQIINFLTTNFSYFMREWEHFKYFRDVVLSELKSVVRNDLCTWSAGCSTGQEPYTLAMLIEDFLSEQKEKWDAKVLATDISIKALDAAKAGIFNDDCLKKVPPYWKLAYFSKISNGKWQVKDSLKNEVIFRRFNLIEDTFPFKKKFHVIFCRNVM
ncbi:MAG: protein-glutamate O-methyltransferase CheR, partial [Eubacteriales bacterium]|nr:protein-glutamate O-methyltransferase CheR [Eubacteriales bacterium]